MSFSVLLPFSGNGIRVTQWNGDFNTSGDSHDTSSITTAFDFALARYTPVLAVAAGRVVSIRESVPDGSTNDSQGSTDPSLGPNQVGNFVTIVHNEGTAYQYYTSYLHLGTNSVPVNEGDSVSAGQVIGYVGLTGARTGAHLHVHAGFALKDSSGTGYPLKKFADAQGQTDILTFGNPDGYNSSLQQYTYNSSLSLAGSVNATPITLSGNTYSVSGSVGFGAYSSSWNTDDYFSFVAPSSGTLTLQLSGLSDDLDLRVLSTEGQRLAQSQNGGTLAESISQLAVVAGTTYLIHVDPYRTAASNYSLNVLFAANSTAHNPIITSNNGADASSILIPENTLAVTTVTATDQDGGAITFSIVGGDDAARFKINSSTGALSFLTAPNYEAPTDVGANNSYIVTVRATDNTGLTDQQTITVNITDVNEGSAHDDIYVDTNNQYDWSRVILHYDAQNRLYQQDVDYDNNTYAILKWDVTNQYTWFEIAEYYNSSFVITSRLTNNDDQSHQLQVWDRTGQSWSDYITYFDSAWRQTSQTIHQDDGGRIELTWDAANQSNWFDTVTVYNSAGQKTISLTNYDSGNHGVRVWDVLNQATWSDVLYDYDSAWRLTGLVANFDDNTRVAQGWDVGNLQTWTDYVAVFDSSGRETSAVYNNDNGGHTVKGWDTAGSSPLSDWTYNYNSNWQLTGGTVKYDDGRTYNF